MPNFFIKIATFTIILLCFPIMILIFFFLLAHRINPIYKSYRVGKKEKICLVSVSEFNSWLKGKDSIKWV